MATTTGVAKAVNTNHVLAAAIRGTASARHHGAVARAINTASGVTISNPFPARISAPMGPTTRAEGSATVTLRTTLPVRAGRANAGPAVPRGVVEVEMFSAAAWAHARLIGIPATGPNNAPNMLP